MAHLDVAGNLKGSKLIEGTGSDLANAMQLDSSGNVFIAGSTTSGLDGNPNAGNEDYFIIKLNSAGVTQWTFQFGTSSSDAALALCLDGSGNVLVAGRTLGVLDFSNLGSGDIFITKLDTSGSSLWTTQTGSTNDDWPLAIQADAAGNAVVAGYTEGDMDNNANAGGKDVFVLKISSSGFPITWVYQLGSLDDDVANDLKLDSSGNIYVTGYTKGSMDFQYWAGGKDQFILKLDSAGTNQFTYIQGTALDEEAFALQLDAVGDVVIAGRASGGLDGYPVVGGSDLFFQNVDGVNGWHRWTRMLGTTGEG